MIYSDLLLDLWRIKTYSYDNAGIEDFEEKQIRTIWDEVQEKWYFSIVDVVMY